MVTTGKKISKKKTARSSSKTAKVKSKKAFSTYDKALKYLFDRTDYERETKFRYNVSTFDLSRMKKLLSELGNPHKKIATVHIAGTKGKGSTATMLANMLEANGYSVGLYTSPHLLSIHERIMINSEMISKTEMLNLLNRSHSTIQKLAKKDSATFFEIMTALAFMHFADSKVDIAIIETGLGGRLDSTNLITPKVVGITSLSIDHQAQLGNTLESIAKEKAGIFKPNIPIVTVKQKPEALRVLQSEALAMNAPLSITGRDIDFSYRFETSRKHGPHTRICLSTPTSKFEHLRVPLHGKHQAINCSLALSMLDVLKNNGYPVDNEKTISGLNTVNLPGRMELINDDPRIMIDAAHNADSLKSIIHAIGQNVPYDSMVVIFGCNKDKDVDGMLRMLQYGADKVIFTRSNSPRAISPDLLVEKYTEICGKMCQSSNSLGEALNIANSAVGKDDLICITGSFYLIGQAKRRFQQNPNL